jgi:hypothetical protein
MKMPFSIFAKEKYLTISVLAKMFAKKIKINFFKLPAHFLMFYTYFRENFHEINIFAKIFLNLISNQIFAQKWSFFHILHKSFAVLLRKSHHW